MKRNRLRNKKAFTLVELIIVIAVIGVLAAILIPTFTNVIDKANAKSALSDARNTVTQYITEAFDNGSLPENIVIFVKKANKFYSFGYNLNGDGSVQISSANPSPAKNFDELLNGYSWNKLKGDTPAPNANGKDDSNTPYDISQCGAFYLFPYNADGTMKGATKSVKSGYRELNDEMKGIKNISKDVYIYHGVLVGGSYVLDTGSQAPVETATPEPPATRSITVKLNDTWNGENSYKSASITVDATGNHTITAEELQSIDPEFTIDGAYPTVSESDTEVAIGGTRNRVIEGDLYRVLTTAKGIQKINTNVDDVNGANSFAAKYIVNNSISSGFEDWVPIGWVNKDADGNPIATSYVQFKGVFDGGGYILSGLSMRYTKQNNENTFVGFFARTNASAKVRNLRLSLGATGVILGYYYIGGVVGGNAGLISNVLVTGGIIQSTRASDSSTSHFTGGIAGQNAGTIEQCISRVSSINSTTHAGGICGYNTGVIDQCLSHSGINCTSYDDGYNIEYAATASKAGGICGNSGGNSTISNCIVFLFRDICGNSSVGAIAGSVGTSTKTATIINCYSDVYNTGTGDVGEVKACGENPADVHAAIGKSLNGGNTFTNCYYVSQISEKSDEYFTEVSKEQLQSMTITDFGGSEYADIWVFGDESYRNYPRLANVYR